MSRRVVISGLGPVSGLGIGAEPNWDGLRDGRSAIARIEAFDPSGFDCRIASEVRDFKVAAFVPKTYRKATKVMARDIGLAVAGADLAARDAGLVTKGTADNGKAALSYDPTRVGAHIGAGLIAVDLDELTEALAEATDEAGAFDYHRWGAEGINHLTPLWLLKYLPNMLACHVTIIHDAQGPSNTITCAETSGLLSIGESLRVIQRDAADLCFCGGAESKINPMAYLRQLLTGRINRDDNDRPTQAVRPFSRSANGTVLGEGAGIVTLESAETFEQRRQEDGDGRRAYAEVIGFGASQTVTLNADDLSPGEGESGLTLAIEAAMSEAGVTPEQIDMVTPFGIGLESWDRAEADGLRRVLGDRFSGVPLVTTKPNIGNCGAGAGGLDVCAAAMVLAEQTLPPRINCDDPIDGVPAGSTQPQQADLRHALVCGTGLGGQNAAVVLRRLDD